MEGGDDDDDDDDTLIFSQCIKCLRHFLQHLAFHLCVLPDCPSPNILVSYNEYGRGGDLNTLVVSGM